MRPSWQFLAFGTIASISMIASGALWFLAPRRFVSLYRRVFHREKAAKTVGWERAVTSVSGRIFAALWFAFGSTLLWILYTPYR